MSLENAIADLTAELKRNSALLEIMTSKAGASVKAAPVKAAPAKSEDDGDDAPAKAAAKPAAKRAAVPAKAATKPAAKAKKPTLEQLKDAGTAFLDVDEDSDVYTERRALIKRIAERFGVKRLSDMDEADYGEALEILATLAAGENFDFDDEGDSDEDDGI